MSINTNFTPTQFTHSDSDLHSLQTYLSSYLGYKEIILLDAQESAFELAFSLLPSKSTLLCSPTAPVSLFNALLSSTIQPHYCDLRLDGTMETRFLRKYLDAKTKALVLSHNYGQLSHVKDALTFCKENELLFIEDATHAFEAREKSGAQLVVYDFELLLPSTLMQGGFIATDDTELANRLRKRAKGGFEQKKFWNYDLLNSQRNRQLSPLLASVILQEMQNIESHVRAMKNIQAIYLAELSKSTLLELPSSPTLTAYPLFPVALVPALFCPKEDIYQTLIEAGISLKVGNKPIYKTTAFLNTSLSFFGAEEVYKAQFLLPAYPNMSEEEVHRVITVLLTTLATYNYRGCSF